MLRLGLFGAGRIGGMHARNLAAHPEVELAGIFDIDAAASAEAARQTGSKAVDSVDDLLGDAAVEGVLIASATDTHCDLIERSAKAGKAVLCEKPIHLDIKRVEACAKVVANTGAFVQIGFNRRFDPSHSAVRQAAIGGELGKLEQAVITSRDPAPPPLDYLRVSGGLFRDMMIHDFDMARFLFGEDPAEVTAMGGVLIDPRIGEVGDVDAAMVILRMASGGLCHINCSRRCAYGYDQRVELFGQHGMLVSANPSATNVERFTDRGTAARDRLHHFFIERYAESYIREIDAFVSALKSGTSASPGFEDGRRALVIANAAIESATRGRTVRIRD